MLRDESPTKWRILAAAALVSVLLATAVLSGCGGGTSSASQSEMPPNPTYPPPWELSRPGAAVQSFLYWISLAYRVANSDVASQTFTPFEEVRVNSYVQYNLEQKRAIDQKLTAFAIKSVTTKENTATVTTREEWLYRYISTVTGRYQGPTHTATYDATYTVVLGKDSLWRVDKVDAKSIGKVE